MEDVKKGDFVGISYCDSEPYYGLCKEVIKKDSVIVQFYRRSYADFRKEVSDPKLDSYVVKRKDIDKLSKINQGVFISKTNWLKLSSGYIFIHIPAKLVSKSQGKKDEVISLSGKSHDQVDLGKIAYFYKKIFLIQAMAEWALHNASLQEDHEKVSTCMIEIDRLKQQIKRYNTDKNFLFLKIL